jgi:hypothetical protein
MNIPNGNIRVKDNIHVNNITKVIDGLESQSIISLTLLDYSQITYIKNSLSRK